MFPTHRLARIALAFGTLIFALTIVLPAVTFHVTDAGIGSGSSEFLLVTGNGDHIASNITTVHFGACEFVGDQGLCVHKELRYDHAHGIRLLATVTSRQSAGI
jgi:hypothetical protein